MMKKRLFCMKHTGSAAVETTILTPLVATTLLFLISLLFYGLSYVAYNNLANNIASNMNMRQSGYIDAYNNHPEVGVIINHNLGTTSDFDLDTPGQRYLQGYGSNIFTYTGKIDNSHLNSNVYLRRGLYSAIDKNRANINTDNLDFSSHSNETGTIFQLPFSQITAIRVCSAKEIDVNQPKNFKGNIITVQIDFKSLLFGMGDTISLPEISTTGYSVIN